MRTLVLVLLAVAPVAADTVVLRSGGTFEGIVTEAGDRVTVKMDVGTVTFRKIDVARITLSRSPLIVFHERLNGLADADIAGRLDLAAWAAENDLDQNAKSVYESVIRREANNETARAALGYRKHDGRWLLDDEIHLAKGDVRWKGGWISASEYEKILKDKEDELKRQAEIDKLKADLAAAQAAAAQAAADAAAIRDQMANTPPVIVYLPSPRPPCCRRPSSHEPGCCAQGVLPVLPVLPPPAPVGMCAHNPCGSTCWMWVRDHMKK